MSHQFNHPTNSFSVFYLKKKTDLVEMLKSQRPRREPNRVRTVSRLDKMLHQSCYEEPINYYFTSGRKVIWPRTVEKECSPYVIDAQRRSNERVHLDHINKLPNYLKPNRRSKPVIGLNDRLHIPKSDPMYPSPKTVTKLATDYFKIILGDPIEETFINKIGYLGRLKKTFYTRLRHAINEEVVLVDEERKLRELSYLIRVRNEYFKMVDIFNRFLAQNLEELLAVTDFAVKMAKLVEMKAIQIEIANGTLENLKECLYELDKILCYRKICKITLDELAPEYWKRKYAKEKDKLQPIADKAADYVLQMLAYFKLEIPLPEDDLEKLVLHLAKTIRTLGPPALYFKYPSEVHLALKKLEHSTVVAIQTLEISSQRREEVVEKDREFERDEKKSLSALRKDIDIIKEEYLKKLSPIITIEEETGVILSYWRAVATNPDLLQAFVHIKCLYEEFIGDEVPTKDIVEMLSLLTEKIIDVQMKVILLPSEETNRIYQELKSKDDSEIQNALVARKLRTETNIMLKKMKKSFENRIRHPGLPHLFKMIPEKKQKIKVDPPRPITPPNKRILKNVMKIFQPTVSQEAYLNFLDSGRNLRKVEEQLKVVQYPPTYPEIVKPDYTEPPATPTISFRLDEDDGKNVSDTSSSYIARMSADAKVCSMPDLSG